MGSWIEVGDFASERLARIAMDALDQAVNVQTSEVVQDGPESWTVRFLIDNRYIEPQEGLL